MAAGRSTQAGDLRDPRPWMISFRCVDVAYTTMPDATRTGREHAPVAAEGNRKFGFA